MYRDEHAGAARSEEAKLAEGLTSKQEIVEINIFDSLQASIRDAILAELSKKPEHKIIALSITSYSEFASSYRALVVIEYL